MFATPPPRCSTPQPGPDTHDIAESTEPDWDCAQTHGRRKTRRRIPARIDDLLEVATQPVIAAVAGLGVQADHPEDQGSHEQAEGGQVAVREVHRSDCREAVESRQQQADDQACDAGVADALLCGSFGGHDVLLVECFLPRRSGAVCGERFLFFLQTTTSSNLEKAGEEIAVVCDSSPSYHPISFGGRGWFCACGGWPTSRPCCRP